MSEQVLVTEQYLQDIADAIREKLKGSDTYTPGEMAAAILSIRGVGNLEALAARLNGIYTPSAPVDGWDEVTVQVPTFTAEITQDAVEFTGDSVSVGDSSVEFDTLPVYIEKNITVNGTYDPAEEGADAYSRVVVDVDAGTLLVKDVTENGSYTAAEDGVYGYSGVRVNVPVEGLRFTAMAARNNNFPMAFVEATFGLSELIFTAAAEEASE